jgi:hypothetical protein
MSNQQLTAQDLQQQVDQKPMDGFADDLNIQLSQQPMDPQQYVQQPMQPHQMPQQLPQQPMPEPQIPIVKQFVPPTKEEAMTEKFLQMLQEPLIIAIIYVIVSQRVILSFLAKNISSFSDKKTNITFLGLCIVGIIIGVLFSLTKQILIKQKMMVA